MKQQGSKINFNGEKVFVAMDVHKNDWKVAFCTVNRQPSRHPITITHPFIENLSSYLNKHYPGAAFEICYEAGFCGFWIYHELTALGHKVLVANPADIPTSDKERKHKEDKRDARKIARGLKEESIIGIYVPDEEVLRERSLVRERYSIAKSLRRIKTQIRSHLMLYNQELRDYPSKNHWSKRYINDLSALAEKESDLTLQLQLTRLNDLRVLMLKANRSLRAIGKSAKYEKLFGILISVPGVGMLTTMQLITEIVDMKRFSNFDKLCSYVGFIPMTHSSSDNERVGPITKRSNKRLRTALVESSWTAVGSDPELLLKYEQYRKRMKGQQAIVYIAKILLRRIRYVWLNEVEYKKGVNLETQIENKTSQKSK